MKLEKAPGLFSEKNKSPSVCESCGEEFICGAMLKDCWCMDIKLTDEDRKNLKDNYKKCLCKNCLTEYSSVENKL